MGTRRGVSPLLLCAGLTLASASGIGLDAAAGSAAAGPRALSARRAGQQHGRPLARPQLLAADAQHVFDVTAFGAKGDNSTDDTGAFAKALEAAHAAGGGMVSVPPGLFVLAGKLTIPPGVSLTGSYRVVPSHDIRGHQPITDGTVLIPTGGRGSIGCPPDPESSDPNLDCEDAFITIAENGLVQGLVVWYKEQERTATPVPYPWTFFLGDPKKVYSGGASADNAAVMDVEVLGCWNCVAAVQAHRHYIARIQGHPINIGVFVDATYDIGRIEDVHFNPWYSDGHPFYYWQTTHGRAFVFGRSDWEYVFNTFAFAYAIGYHFIERETGSMNGNFLGIGMDAATNASVQVDQSQPYGILITNGEFTAFCDVAHGFCPPHTPDGSQFAPVHVRVLPGNQGAVKFITSSFWGPAAGVAVADGIGTVSFTECHFDQWDNHLNANGSAYEHRGSPAVEQLGGTLILSGNEFPRPGTQLSIAAVGPLKPRTKTIVAENIIKGPLKIENGADKRAKVIVANNADDSDDPDQQ